MNQPYPKSDEPSIADPAPLSVPGDPAATEVQRSESWNNDHAINIRLTIPLLFWRFYLTIVAGKERRSTQRRQQERQRHPLFKGGNLMVFGYAGMIVLLALGAIIGATVVMLIRKFFEVEIILQ